MIKVELGQPVMVATGYKASAQPGEIVKIGRVWIEIKTEAGKGWHQNGRFRLDDQTDGSKIGVSAHFYTLEQWAEKERRGAALEFLKSQGITLEYGSPWRGREAELAALVRPATVRDGA